MLPIFSQIEMQNIANLQINEFGKIRREFRVMAFSLRRYVENKKLRRRKQNVSVSFPLVYKHRVNLNLRVCTGKKVNSDYLFHSRPSRNRQLQLTARAACRASPFECLPANLLHSARKTRVTENTWNSEHTIIKRFEEHSRQNCEVFELQKYDISSMIKTLINFVYQARRRGLGRKDVYKLIRFHVD